MMHFLFLEWNSTLSKMCILYLETDEVIIRKTKKETGIEPWSPYMIQECYPPDHGYALNQAY